MHVITTLLATLRRVWKPKQPVSTHQSTAPPLERPVGVYEMDLIHYLHNLGCNGVSLDDVVLALGDVDYPTVLDWANNGANFSGFKPDPHLDILRQLLASPSDARRPIIRAAQAAQEMLRRVTSPEEVTSSPTITPPAVSASDNDVAPIRKSA
jgi:hypothetical protein